MSLKIRLFVMMALQLAIWGAWAPKLFPYMALMGFRPWQQSLVGASWGIAAVTGVFFASSLADRRFAGERLLAVSHFVGGIALVCCAFATSFWPFFAAYLAFSLLYVPALSVANSITFAHLREPAKDFGAVRMGGTFGWIVVSWPFIFLLEAQTSASQVRWIFLVSAAISVSLAFYALTLPHTPPHRDAAGSIPWRKAIALLRTPFVAVLFAVTFIDAIIHNGYFIMADDFLTRRVGIAGNLSMVVLSLGQLAEIVAMLLLGRAIARLGWKNTMIFGILGHAIRFSVFAFMPDSVPLVIAAQLLHGICYAFFFATVYIFVDAVFPAHMRNTAQGLFNLLILGVGNVVASLIFPTLISHFTSTAIDPTGASLASIDYRALFLVPTGMALCAVLTLATWFRPPPIGNDQTDAASLSTPAAAQSPSALQGETVRASIS